MKSDEDNKGKDQLTSNADSSANEQNIFKENNSSSDEHHPGLVILARMINRKLNEGKKDGKDLLDSRRDSED